MNRPTYFEGGPLDGKTIDIEETCQSHMEAAHFDRIFTGEDAERRVRRPRFLYHTYIRSREWKGVWIFTYQGCTAEY